MKIEHNGMEWSGTFGATLRYLLDDLLSGGEPITVRVTYDDPDAVGHVRTATTTINVMPTFSIELADGTAAHMDDVLALEVL